MWYFSVKKISQAPCMINFHTIEYLREGNNKQQRAHRTLVNYAVLQKLNEFDPRLVGTIPLDIDIEGSDLDIICCWKNKNRFIETVIESFADQREFLLSERKILNRETILATFLLDEFTVEIFGQNRPTKEQDAYRHMIAEYFILTQNDNHFRESIRKLKKEGLTTEEAFAKLLNLPGDPYLELLTFGASN